MAGIGSAHKRFEAYLKELGWEGRAGTLVKEGKGEPAPEVVVLLELVAAAEDARSHVRTSAATINKTIFELAQAIERPRPLLNSQGELQGKSAALEAAVGAFSAVERLLARFLAVYRPLASHPDENKPGCAQCGYLRDLHLEVTSHKFKRP